MSTSPLDDWLADDPEVAGLLSDELTRQRTTLQLIASENFASPAVLAATGSVLTNKYAEGYPGRRYYGGNQVIDEVEDLARNRLGELFGAEHANVQPHSGANANLGVYLALLDPGDTILAMRLDQGGHLTHGSPASITSKVWRFVSYGLTPPSDDSDAGRAHRPRPGPRPRPRAPPEADRRRRHRLLAHHRRQGLPRPSPMRSGRCFDVRLRAHGRAHRRRGAPEPRRDRRRRHLHHPQDPARTTGRRDPVRRGAGQEDRLSHLPRAPGRPARARHRRQGRGLPRGAQPDFRDYAAQVVRQRQGPGRRPRAEGFRLVSGGTDNHLVLFDLRSFDAELTGKEAQEVMDRGGITANRNTVPDDPRSPFVTSGLRLGTAAETTAGMGTAEMATIASLIGRVAARPRRRAGDRRGAR